MFNLLLQFTEIFSLSRILINLIHEISDSPRSNLDICDLERFSSEIEQILTCLFLRIFLSVFPKVDFITFPTFTTKNSFNLDHYIINQRNTRRIINEKQNKNFISSNTSVRHSHYCRRLKR